MLRVAMSDKTFQPARVSGRPALVGKCIHCRTKLAISVDGDPISAASIEHIVPRCHGGTNDLENLAIACQRCNAEKGYRHDVQHASDPKLLALIETLKRRRHERRRDPDEDARVPSPARRG